MQCFKQLCVLDGKQGLFLPVLADCTGGEADETEMEVGGSGGTARFPIKDLARSRHCSASLNIRSPSTAAISLSSMGNRKMKKALGPRMSKNKIMLMIVQKDNILYVSIKNSIYFYSYTICT